MRYTYYDSSETQLNSELLPDITICAYFNKGYKRLKKSSVDTGRWVNGSIYTGLRRKKILKFVQLS